MLCTSKRNRPLSELSRTVPLAAIRKAQAAICDIAIRALPIRAEAVPRMAGIERRQKLEDLPLPAASLGGGPMAHLAGGRDVEADQLRRIVAGQPVTAGPCSVRSRRGTS